MKQDRQNPQPVKQEREEVSLKRPAPQGQPLVERYRMLFGFDVLSRRWFLVTNFLWGLAALLSLLIFLLLKWLKG